MAEGVNISMDFDDKEGQALLGGIIRRGSDPRPCYPKVVTLLHRSTAETFRREGRPEKWKPLSKRTIAMRRKGKGSGTFQVYGAGGESLGSVSTSSVKILQDTGRLMTSVTSKSASSIVRSSPHELEVGTNVPYSVTHQRGRKGKVAVTQKVRSHRRKVKGRRQKTTVQAHLRHVVFGPVPARPFLAWHPDAVRGTVVILGNYVAEGN